MTGPRDESAMADRVAELAARLERGEEVDPSTIADASPEEAAELRRLLPTIRRLASLGRGPTPIIPEAIPHHEGPARMLGDFRLIREVGRGGMGVVYEAEQVSLGRRVALKILPLAAALDPRHYQRFLLEARAAACLLHLHIVPVHAVGADRDVPYYAMRFIEGQSLAELIQELRRGEGLEPMEGPSLTLEDSPSYSRLAALLLSGRLGAGPEPGAEAPVRPPAGPARAPLAAPGPGPGASPSGTSRRDRAYLRTATRLAQQAAEALDHAHARGILHRDIKPDNLMLGLDGHLWVTDFGLAQVQGQDGLTITGDHPGTLRYMSPEQALARRVVLDGRTDVYSLGATLYELLTLRPAIAGKDRAEILERIAREEPASPRVLNPAVPPDLETIVRKAMAKEPDRRYATARDLADDLARFLDGRPIVARRPGPAERLARWSRRNRAVAIPAASFAILAILALGGGLIWSNNWLRAHNDALRIERDRAAKLAEERKALLDLSERRRRINELHGYAYRLRQGADTLHDHHLEKAQEILADCRPRPDEEDLRGFAWRYLWREARRQVAVLSGRGERPWSLALSADGRGVAIGDMDGTIRLRDAATGELRLQFGAHRVPIRALAFSPDGRRLASGTGYEEGDKLVGRGELLVWDAATGRPIARLDGSENRWVGRLRFDPSGETLWEVSDTAAGRTEVGLWKLEPGPGDVRPRLLRRWPGRRHKDSIQFPVSDDGRRIASYEDDGRVVVVEDVVPSRVTFRLPRAPQGYECVAISGDGRILATAARDRPEANARLNFWDARSGRPIGEHRLDTSDTIVQLEIGQEGRSLLARGARSSLRCITLDRGATWSITPKGVDRPENSTDFGLLPGGRFLAWSDRNGLAVSRLLEILDAGTGAVRATFPGLPTRSNCPLGNPDGRSLAFVADLRAVIWHYEPVADPQPAGHTDEAWSVAFSGDGRIVATGSDDSDDPMTLKLWDVASGKLVRGWKPHAGTTGAIAFQPGGPLMATAALSLRENLRLWDASTGDLIAPLDGHADSVRTLAFRPDGRVLASAGNDRVIRLWDTATRRCVRTLEGHTDTVRQVAYSPDGRVLASAGNDFTVRLWDADGTGSVLSSEGVKVAAVAFAPDGRTLAWAHQDGVIRRWDIAGKLLLDPLHSELNELRCLAFSPDGRTLAAAGKSGSIHLWDPISGQQLLVLPGRPVQLNALAFSPDGSTLAACWHDGTVRLVRAD